MGVFSRGLGGGGSMFAPRISPWPPPQPDLWFVACDLLGLYQSADHGQNWTMLDAREVTGGDRFSVAFDPTTPGHYVAHHRLLGLREWKPGATGWAPFAVALSSATPAPLDGTVVTAAAFRPSNGELILGTTQGIYKQTGAGAFATWQQAYHTAPKTRADDTSTPPTVYQTSDVLAFAFFTVGGSERLFAATTTQILESTTGGATWTVIGDTLTQNQPQQPGQRRRNSWGLQFRDVGPAVLPDDTRASGRVISGIRGFAGGQRTTQAGATVAGLWVTLEPNRADLANDSGGVFYTEPAGAATQWDLAMGAGASALPVTRAGAAGYGIYEQLAVPAGDASRVYVTSIAPDSVAGTDYWVYRGALTSWTPPAAPQLSWTGIYDGFQNHTQPPSNLNPAGWSDLEPTAGLGWGFGGSARGFTLDPKSSDVLAYTNQSVVHSSGNATQNAVTWAQRYTTPAGGGSWHTVGLDVTTTWQYAVNAGVHFLCSTDIGLARSSDGVAWALATYSVPQPSAGTLRARWGNFYQLAFPGGQTVWAAVSVEHDIPHETERWGPADTDPTNTGKIDRQRGAVLTSTDNGATWTIVAGSRRRLDANGKEVWVSDTTSGLNGEHPVVSILARDIVRASSPNPTDSVLVVSVWGDGVYWSGDQGAQWNRLGSLPTLATPVHCYRVWLDAASGDLFCNVVARPTAANGFQPGALFRLPSGTWNPTTPGSPQLGTTPVNAPWVDTTQALVPAGSTVLNPVDFTLDPAGNILLATADHQGTNAGGGLYRGVVTRPTAGVFNVAWSANLLPATAFAHLGYTPSLRPLTPSISDGWLYVPTLFGGIVASPYDPASGWTPTWHDFDALPFIGAQRIEERKTAAGSGSLYLSTFGGGTWEVERRCAFVTDHSTISRAEVAPFNPTPAARVRVDRVAYLVLDGYTQFEVGLTANSPQTQITAAPNNGITVTVSAAAADPGATDGTVCRRTYTIALEFSDPTAFPQQPGPPVPVTLTFTRGAYSCQATIQLVFPNRPYMLDGPAPWLSQDTRVFQVSDGATFAGRSFQQLSDRNDDAAASAAAGVYLRTLLQQLNSGQGQKVFEDENPGLSVADKSQQLELARTDGSGARVFNYAVARVRWEGNVGSGPTRVFFRLAPGPAGGFVYSPADSNRVLPAQTPAPPASVPRVPLLGLSANLQDLVSVPCFADDRIDYTVAALTAQPNGAAEVASIPAAAAGSPTVAYFGCWLDFNQPRRLFPDHPPAGNLDGQWAPADLRDFPTLLKGQHQCLTVEVHYDVGAAGAPQDILAAGDMPGSSDHFSQRNLAINGIDNPGSRSTHTVYHPFSIRGMRQPPPAPTDEDERLPPPDELLISWGNLPQSTRATITFSGVTADEVLELERGRGGRGGLSRVDADTLACAVGGATYIPIPPVDHDLAALVALELPPSVRYGERYGALLQQVGGPEQAVLGGLQIDIPVQPVDLLLPPERNALAVLRYAANGRRQTDRWTPIMRRYIAGIADRVDGFGGNARSVRASLDGDHRPDGCLLALWDLAKSLLGRRR